MDKKEYTHRYIARVILEAETPLFVGSGETALLKDALVQRDLHGFPMIQGTSLAGVLRHALLDKFDEKTKQDKKPEEQIKWESFFGYQSPKGKKGLGSQVKISSAYLVLENGKVAEGLTPDFDISKYQKHFEELPMRQHVRINEKGVAHDKGLFDNEVFYKGCRFLFEIELKGDEKDKNLWDEFPDQLISPLFRLGQGTRNGYGDLSVKECKAKVFDLKNGDFDAYLNFDNSLNAQNSCLKPVELEKEKQTHYKLVLNPENFFMFGAGYGDAEVDNIPVTEEVVTYQNGTIQKPQKQTLIPASSVKGALSHRTAFHYNKEIKRYADNYANEIKENTEKLIDFVETDNDAVYELFGAEEGHKTRDGMRGKVIINDMLLDEKYKVGDKIFNHVAIDRFTGGAMDGALFSEKVSYFEDENQEIELDIYIEDFENDKKEMIIGAFEKALKDVCKGLLPLGGMTTKGHGIFTGKLFKNNEEVEL
jgi:CRISPR/Cas system CSM-associated protein Csm3 (group 7 of RAMP superfamily)